jgi:hypothetical protein
MAAVAQNPLEVLVEGASLVSMIAGQSYAIACKFNNTLPYAQNIGDLIHIGFYSFVSVYIGRGIETASRKDSFMQRLGKYFSEITIPLTTAYFALGETLINWIPLNTMDVNDVPAALAAGIVGIGSARALKKMQ